MNLPGPSSLLSRDAEISQDAKWLRDDYAMKAFEILVQKYAVYDLKNYVIEAVVRVSYKLADEMIKGR